MNISIVIPNYNGEEILKKNLPTVVNAMKNHKGKVEIIVTDDASKDESLTFLKKFSSSIKERNMEFIILESPYSKNSGFSANVNRGVHRAHGEIVILLNTDVSPHNDFLIPLLAHFQEASVFAVGCVDESMEEGNVVLRGAGRGEWRRGFLLHRAGDIANTQTLWVSCGSGAFRKGIWDKLGGLEELYNPFYWEDIDLSYRAQKFGYTVLLEPRSKVVHEHSKGIIKTAYKPYTVQKIAYRNQFYFVWLNITDQRLLLSHFLWFPIHILFAFKDKNKSFFVGLGLALLNLPQVLSKRRVHVAKFKVSDKQILNKFSQ